MTIVVFYAIAFLWKATSVVSDAINKCCPEGQKLGIDSFGGIMCTDIAFYEHEESFNSSSFDWFPVDSIVNATTLKNHQNNKNKYLKILKENFEIKKGFLPDCGEKFSPQEAFFDLTFQFFHFILDDSMKFKIHISKPNTLHDFEKENAEFWKLFGTKMENESESDNYTIRTFPLDDACVDLGPNHSFILKYCPCRYTICIRKCCNDGLLLNETSGSCEKIEDTLLKVKNWRPQTDGMVDRYYLLTEAVPQCDNAIMLKKPTNKNQVCGVDILKESDNDFTISTNGSVKIKKYKRLYSPENYCGEVTWHENGVVYEQNLVICMSSKPARNQKVQPVRFLLYGILLMLGGTCLLITVAVSFYLPELRRKMHNKIALNHNFSLMIAYFAGGAVQLSPNLEGNSCIILGLLIQFTFLGSFFWLNVMCIDISMTFRANRSVGGSITDGEKKKFILYSVYSWGTTTIISIVTIVMEFLPRVPYNYLRPGFTCYCGFDTDTSAVLIYFYGPMAFILTMNLIFFVFTTIKIMMIQRQTSILHKPESKATGGVSYQTDKQRLILYAKLFLLMGLSWITEIASWAIGGPDYYWYLSDVINLLRAVFIFILFICKKNVLVNLKRKLRQELLSASNSTKSESTKNKQNTLRTTHSSRDFHQVCYASKKNQRFGHVNLTNINNLTETQI